MYINGVSNSQGTVSSSDDSSNSLPAFGANATPPDQFQRSVAFGREPKPPASFLEKAKAAFSKLLGRQPSKPQKQQSNLFGWFSIAAVGTLIVGGLAAFLSHNAKGAENSLKSVEKDVKNRDNNNVTSPPAHHGDSGNEKDKMQEPSSSLSPEPAPASDKLPEQKNDTGSKGNSPSPTNPAPTNTGKATKVDSPKAPAKNNVSDSLKKLIESHDSSKDGYLAPFIVQHAKTQDDIREFFSHQMYSHYLTELDVAPYWRALLKRDDNIATVDTLTSLRPDFVTRFESYNTLGVKYNFLMAALEADSPSPALLNHLLEKYPDSLKPHEWVHIKIIPVLSAMRQASKQYQAAAQAKIANLPGADDLLKKSQAADESARSILSYLQKMPPNSRRVSRCLLRCSMKHSDCALRPLQCKHF